MLSGRPTLHAMDLYMCMIGEGLRARTLLKLLRYHNDVPLSIASESGDAIERTPQLQAQGEYINQPNQQQPQQLVTSLSSSLLRIPSTDDTTPSAKNLFGDGYPPFPSAHTYRSTEVSMYHDN
jgi:Transcription factor TFIID complex subunit 8 C-term